MPKRLLLLFLFVLFLVKSFGQTLRQFTVQEVVGLFDKTQTQVYKYLSEKHYSYKGTEEGFEKYENVTGMGTFHLTLVFKNSKTKVIGTEESFIVARDVTTDLLNNFFKIKNSFTEVKEFIPHEGCMYGLKNDNLGVTATYIISKFNPYVVVVNYWRDPKNKVVGNLLQMLKASKQSIENKDEIDKPINIIISDKKDTKRKSLNTNSDTMRIKNKPKAVLPSHNDY